MKKLLGAFLLGAVRPVLRRPSPLIFGAAFRLLTGGLVFFLLSERLLLAAILLFLVEEALAMFILIA